MLTQARRCKAETVDTPVKRIFADKLIVDGMPRAERMENATGSSMGSRNQARQRGQHLLQQLREHRSLDP